MGDLGWPLSKAIHRCVGKPKQPDGRRNEVHFRETNPSTSRASVRAPIGAIRKRLPDRYKSDRGNKANAASNHLRKCAVLANGKTAKRPPFFDCKINILDAPQSSGGYLMMLQHHHTAILPFRRTSLWRNKGAPRSWRDQSVQVRPRQGPAGHLEASVA